MARVTNAELRDRLDGLALAFFAVSGAMIDALVDLHEDSDASWKQMRSKAFELILGLEDLDQIVFTPSALDQALRAVIAAFAARGGPIDEDLETEGDNDNEQG